MRGVMVCNMTDSKPLTSAISREVINMTRNFFIVISGRTQMRKSTIAIKLALDLEPNFDLTRQLAMVKAQNFLDALNLDGLKRGSVIVLDEFQVGQDHRSWYTFLNKAINYVMQTHGERGLILIVTTPSEDFIDSDTRKLIDLTIHIENKNETHKYVTADVRAVEYRSGKADPYRKYLYGKYDNGMIKKLRRWKLHFPPNEIMDRYFPIAKQEKTALRNELAEAASHLESEKRRKGLFNPAEYAEKVLADLEQFTMETHGRRHISRELIKATFPGIGDDRARIIKAVVEKQPQTQQYLAGKQEQPAMASTISQNTSPTPS